MGGVVVPTLARVKAPVAATKGRIFSEHLSVDLYTKKLRKSVPAT